MTRLIAFLLVTTVAASAQAFQPGDLLVGTSSLQTGSKLLAVKPYQNRYTTVAVIPNSLVEGVDVGPANTDVFVAGNRLVRVTTGGVVTNVLPFYLQGSVATPDEDGRLLFATGSGLLSIDLLRNTLTTIRAGIVSKVVLDRDTGDYLVGEWPQLLRLKRDGTATTIIPFMVHGMAYHPQTGETFVLSGSTVYRLDRSHRLTTFVSDAGTGASLAVLENGHIAIGPTGTHITEFDVKGNRIGTLYSGDGFSKTGMVVAGSNHVWGRNAPVRGAVFDLSIRFGSHPTMRYAAAAALARAPGIPIAGDRIIPLAPDALFFTSLVVPEVFRGFHGVLDASGAAAASVALPDLPGLQGVRVFYAAVVLDPTAPGGIAAVSRTFGATIQ